MRIGEQRIRDGLPLCCVIPIVIYHGPVTWNVARTVGELIDVPERLTGILGLLSDLEGAEGLESIKMVLRYIASGSDRVTVDDLNDALRKGLKSKGESMMPTIADQWVQQGHEKGREEGREEGVMIGQVRAYQELLSLSVTPVSELAKLEAKELEALLADLKARYTQ